jgi:hypothetical protein
MKYVIDISRDAADAIISMCEKELTAIGVGTKCAKDYEETHPSWKKYRIDIQSVIEELKK